MQQQQHDSGDIEQDDARHGLIADALLKRFGGDALLVAWRQIEASNDDAREAWTAIAARIEEAGVLLQER